MKKLNYSENRLRAPKEKKGEAAKTVFKTLFLCLIVGSSIAAFLFGKWVYDILAETPPLNPNAIFATGSSLIYDRDGELVDEHGTIRREWVHFHEVSPVMIDALLAIEDSRFFEHHGVDWSRTIVAVMYSARNMATGVDSLQGGSTLTQQLIKMTHLHSGQEIERKLQEILLSIQLERVFSKEQIMEGYLNFAPFGGRIYGIQAASQFYFGVDASDLTLSQAATLAGIVQLPNVHRPDQNVLGTEERRDMVLDLMVRHGFITQELADLAAAEPITDLLVYEEVGLDEITRYQPFIDRVMDEAYMRFGINLAAGGYEVHTTLDREAQAFVFNLLNEDDHFHQWAWADDRLLTAVAMVGNDGQIRALAGRDPLATENVQRGFNLAADGIRAPGSAAKPIWAYGPAMEYLSWGTGTMINDELFAYGNGSGPILRNWDRQVRGRVSVTYAMAASWNVPAIKAMNAVSEQFSSESVVEFVESLGIPPYEGGLLESHAIGTHPVTALQMAGAYNAFATGGEFIEPFTITSITTPDGTVISGEPHRERVMSEATAFMISQTLRAVLTHHRGTGHLANVPGQWLAGKTGTTNFTDDVRAQFGIPRTAVPEASFVGYSMDYTVAIWTGHRYTNDGTFVSETQQRIPRELFAIIMSELNTAGMREPERPAGVVWHPVEWQSGSRDGEACFPSGATPGRFQYGGWFHAHAGPSCTSDRFSAPEAPQNLQVASGGGTTLEFTWDHIENLPMTLEEAIDARDSAREAAAGQTYLTDWLRNLNPSEADAAMLVDQIQAIGETEYAIFATLTNGSTRELATTRDDSYTLTDLTRSDLASIASFHVVARFSNSGTTSEPSNSVPNDGLIDPSEFEITIPDMEGWSRNQVEQWARTNDVEDLNFVEAYSDTIAEGRVIETNPTGTMMIDETLTIIISRGSEELPQMPGIPIPDPDEPGDEPDDEPVDEPSDSEDDGGLDPFLDPGLRDLIQVGTFSRNRNARSVQRFTAILERVKRGEF